MLEQNSKPPSVRSDLDTFRSMKIQNLHRFLSQADQPPLAVWKSISSNERGARAKLRLIENQPAKPPSLVGLSIHFLIARIAAKSSITFILTSGHVVNRSDSRGYYEEM